MSQLLPIHTLDRFGPDADAPPPSLDEARRYVRDLTLARYENFSVLSRLVPKRLREDVAAVYAFCRWSDDLGDELGASPDDRARSLDLLAWWRRSLEQCFDHASDPDAPAPTHPVFTCLAHTITKHQLSITPFDDLIRAFEQDQTVTRYKTWDQVLDYCTRSANPVGRIVLALDGLRPDHPDAERLLQMSDATCSALQLTNFWQDVRRDLDERDRIYLPLDDLGFSEDDLRRWIDRPDEPEGRVAYIRGVRSLVEKTRSLFQVGRPLPRAMTGDMAPVVWLFGAGGEAVLSRVERIGCTTLWNRPTLSRLAKASLVASAMIRFRSHSGASAA